LPEVPAADSTSQYRLPTLRPVTGSGYVTSAVAVPPDARLAYSAVIVVEASALPDGAPPEFMYSDSVVVARLDPEVVVVVTGMVT
jgi:hypothetical protein